jgi:predicted nucleic acid-binding protein
LLLVIEDDCYAPAFLREEIEKYEPMLRERSGLSEDELDTLLERLFRRITFLSAEHTVRHQAKAEREMRAIDPKDALYVAAALELDAPIWSMDNGFGEQEVVPLPDEFGDGRASTWRLTTIQLNTDEARSVV